MGLTRTRLSRTVTDAISRTRRRGALRRALCIGALMALSSNLAHGQVTPGTRADAGDVLRGDSTVVVEREGAALRCGPSERYYPVARLTPGTLLKVLEADPRGGFLRVAYAPEQSVYVPKEAVESKDDRSLRVVRPTRLTALHAEAGVGGSWRSVLGEPLRVGSELVIHEAIRSETGEITGYKVEPPAGASAWVAIADLQRMGDNSHVVDPREAREAGEGTPPESGDRNAVPQTGGGELGRRSLLEAMVPPTGGTAAPIIVSAGGEPGFDSSSPDSAGGQTGDVAAVPGRSTPNGGALDGANGPQARALATNTPTVVIEQGISGGAPRTEALSVIDLEALYQSARSSETFEDELEALLAEHRRTLEATPDDSFNERLREQLRQRIAYIEMRIAFRDGPAKIAAQRASAPRISEQLQRRLDELRAGQEYVMIGRMVISRVYDGERLPKLYRIRSADALARTLGYVKAGDKDLRPYLDRVVGIAGPVESGPGGARVVTAVRVDLLDE